MSNTKVDKTRALSVKEKIDVLYNATPEYIDKDVAYNYPVSSTLDKAIKVIMDSSQEQDLVIELLQKRVEMLEGIIEDTKKSLNP